MSIQIIVRLILLCVEWLLGICYYGRSKVIGNVPDFSRFFLAKRGDDAIPVKLLERDMANDKQGKNILRCSIKANSKL